MPANEDLAGKLNFFVWLFQFSHSLLASARLEDAAAIAVNDSRTALQFTTASLLELSGSKAKMLAQFGQPEANPHSRLAELHCRLAESHEWGEEPVELSAENGLLPELAENGRHDYCIPLFPPVDNAKTDDLFLLVLEYPGPVADSVKTTAKVLSVTLADALYCKKNAGGNLRTIGRKAGKCVFWIVLLALLVCAMFIPVPDGTTAEFTLKAPETATQYAWFDGPIAECLKQDGDLVRKGEVIAKYDVSQLQYRYETVRGQIRELSAELSLEQQSAFSDETKLGKVMLLKSRLETLRVTEAEAKWFLDHAVLTAPADGVLSLADGRAENLTGKAVRTGDKLFEVMSGDGMTAEIFVNEKDAEILNHLETVTLFLHAAPETAIPCKVLDVAKFPELTEQKVFCYSVRVSLPDQKNNYRFGMRGVAKMSGEPVLLGYRLFKSMVLYFRWL